MPITVKNITLSAATPEALQILIDNYMMEYHPAGYGTSVDERYEADGQYHAKLSRYSSCD